MYESEVERPLLNFMFGEVGGFYLGTRPSHYFMMCCREIKMDLTNSVCIENFR